MKTLVIGGNGFIGSHLVDRLLSEGHTVHVFDWQSERYRKPLKGVIYHILLKLDFVRSALEMTKTVKQQKLVTSSIL